jgi:hypothetical protein
MKIIKRTIRKLFDKAGYEIKSKSLKYASAETIYGRFL